MFNILRKQRPQVTDLWIANLRGIQVSTDDFYESLEKAFEEENIPDLEVKRVERYEGEITTPKRVYLRIQREWFYYDVCSAPFGKGWFFSRREVQIPCELRVWELVVLAGIIGLATLAAIANFGVFIGPLVVLANVVGTILVINTVALNTKRSLDSRMLAIPIFGGIYEACLRNNSSYYREDTRHVFAGVVENVIQEQVKAFAEQQGIQNVEFSRVSEPESPKSFLGRLFDSLKSSFSNFFAFVAQAASKIKTKCQ